MNLIPPAEYLPELGGVTCGCTNPLYLLLFDHLISPPIAKLRNIAFPGGLGSGYHLVEPYQTNK
jgi:hypothetical protein